MIKRYGRVMCNAGGRAGLCVMQGGRVGLCVMQAEWGALICRTVFPVVLVIEHGDVRVVA